MARPTILNQELIDKMAEQIADGLPKCYTCDLFGVIESSFDLWMEKGLKDYENGEDTIYSTLWTAIKNAHARHISDSMKRIKSGAPGWQGTAWWLERTNAKFMPKQQIQADDDGKVNVIIGGKVKDIKRDNNK